MKKPIAILDQFVDKGRTITYMTTFGDQNDGRMRNSIAVFKIYLKVPKSNFLESLFPFIKSRKIMSWAGKHLIANQINHDFNLRNKL